MKKAIGFIGSASREMNPAGEKLAFEIGKLAAKHDYVSYSGACPGFPLAAIRGAKEAGGTTIGIAPAESYEDHVQKWGYPIEEFDSIIFTGMGRARNFIIVRAVQVVVVLGGRVGTFNEVTAAYDDGKIIAVPLGIDGMDKKMRLMSEWFKDKDTGAKIIFGKTPKELMEKIEMHLND